MRTWRCTSRTMTSQGNKQPDMQDINQLGAFCEKQFELYRKLQKEDDIYALEKAARMIDRYVLPKHNEWKKRVQVRREILRLWLTVLNLIDKRWIPDFIIEPVASTDPYIAESEKDPVVRKKLEEELNADREKGFQNRLQFSLKQMNERYSERATQFVAEAYLKMDSDRLE